MSVAVMRRGSQQRATDIAPAKRSKVSVIGRLHSNGRDACTDIASVEVRLRRQGGWDCRSTLRTAPKTGAEVVPAAVTDLPDRRGPIVRLHIQIMGTDSETNAGHHADERCRQHEQEECEQAEQKEDREIPFDEGQDGQYLRTSTEMVREV